MKRNFFCLTALLAFFLNSSPAEAFSSLRPGDRPILPGVHPLEVELLEDSFLRKHPKLLRNSRAAARQLIYRRYQNGRGFLQGYMAEALYVHSNSGWGYVRSPTATQNDAYRWLPGRRAPLTAQVKFHQSGRPYDYARDMVRDFRSHHFVIPDDHVQPTKDYLYQRARLAEMRGEADLAATYWRNIGRLRGMGVTSSAVIESTERAARFSRTGLKNPYVSFGSIVGATILPTLGRPRNEALEALGRSFVDGVAVKTTGDLLRKSRPSMLTRGAGATVVLGSVMTVTNAVFVANRYGFRNALHDEDFYIEVGGATAGWVGGTATAWGLTELVPATLVPSPAVVFAATTLAGYASYQIFMESIKIFKQWRDPLYLHHEFLREADGCNQKRKALEMKLRSLEDAETHGFCSES